MQVKFDSLHRIIRFDSMNLIVFAQLNVPPMYDPNVTMYPMK